MEKNDFSIKLLSFASSHKSTFAGARMSGKIKAGRRWTISFGYL